MWARLRTRAVGPLVNTILEEYAARGVFRGFSPLPSRQGQAAFCLVWHHDRTFELLVDPAAKTLRFPVVLPGVARDSAMYRDFREFLQSLQSEKLPPHRRVDPAKARLRCSCSNRAGNVSVTITAVGDDLEYAVRKLIHAVHAVFLVFLVEGPYYEYMVEHLGLEPDKY